MKSKLIESNITIIGQATKRTSLKDLLHKDMNKIGNADKERNADHQEEKQTQEYSREPYYD